MRCHVVINAILNAVYTLPGIWINQVFFLNIKAIFKMPFFLFRQSKNNLLNVILLPILMYYFNYCYIVLLTLQKNLILIYYCILIHMRYYTFIYYYWYYFYFLANYYKYVPIFFFIFTIFPTPRLPRHFAKYRTIHISGDKLYVRIYTQDACWNYTFRAKLKRSEDLIKLPQYILARLVRFAQYNAYCTLLGIDWNYD